MGDRGQVEIDGVWLYTHWGATELIKNVQTAIREHERWNDDEYLARIIFKEIIGESTGIGTSKHGDVYRWITVDCSNQKITIHCGFNHVQTKTYSFDDFCKEEFENFYKLFPEDEE